MIVDDTEGRLRKPRSIFQISRMDRFVALEQFGGADEDLHGPADVRRRRILDAPAAKDKGASAAVLQDQIEIREAWHLPSRPVAEMKNEDDEMDHDGRHVVTIDGCTLVDEPYDRDHFPFAAYIPRRRRRSYWGLSLLHNLAAPQREFEQVTRKLQKAHEWMGGSHWLTHRDANVSPRELDNDMGTQVEWSGQHEPREWSPQPINPQTYQHQQSLRTLMKECAGVPQMATTGQLPAGMQDASGKAIQLLDDIGSERLKAYHSARDQLTHDRDETLRRVAQLLPSHPAVRLLHSRVAEREQATQVLVARAVLHEERHAPAVTFTRAARCRERNSRESSLRNARLFTAFGAPLSPRSSPKYCARNRLHKNPLAITIQTSRPARPGRNPRKSPCAAPATAFPVSDPGVHHRYGMISKILGLSDLLYLCIIGERKFNDTIDNINSPKKSSRVLRFAITFSTHDPTSLSIVTFSNTNSALTTRSAGTTLARAASAPASIEIIHAIDDNAAKSASP
jgi:hypothetical protein